MSPMSSKRKRRLVITGGVITAYAIATGVALRRGYKFGRNVPVRCLSGHVFSTVWIPGASVKALRLGPWRAQWCPVGRHFTLVTLLKDADLTEEDRSFAAAHHDVLVPLPADCRDRPRVIRLTPATAACCTAVASRKRR
jgi:hypothetical protein